MPIGDTIEGDVIYVECRKYSKWKLFQMSSQHKGSRCQIEKNAKARIVKSYTNLQNKHSANNNTNP